MNTYKIRLYRNIKESTDIEILSDSEEGAVLKSYEVWCNMGEEVEWNIERRGIEPICRPVILDCKSPEKETLTLLEKYAKHINFDLSSYLERGD